MSCLLLGLLLGVLRLVSVLVPWAVPLTSTGLIVAKSRPAIVGNAALGLMGQYGFIDVGQEREENVDGGWVFGGTADHSFFRAS